MILGKHKNSFKKFTAFFTVFILLAGLIFSQTVFALNNSGNKAVNFIGYRITDKKTLKIWVDKNVPSVDSAAFKIFQGSGTDGQQVGIQSASILRESNITGVSGLGGGADIVLTTSEDLVPGQIYTVEINNTIKANNTLTLGQFTAHKDIIFSFTVPDTIASPNCNSNYTTSSSIVLNTWPHDGDSNVAVEGSIWISTSVPVTNYSEVINKLVLKKNNHQLQYDTSINSTKDGDIYAPLVSDDHTYFFFPMTGSGGYTSYNLDADADYELTIPDMTFVTGQTIPQHTIVFHTGGSTVATKISSVPSASQIGDNLQIAWTAPNAVTGVSPAPSGYNVYASTDKYWNYKKLNDSPITGTSFTTSGLIPNTTYYFRVTALSNTNVLITGTTYDLIEGGFSDAVQAITPPDTTPPDWLSGSTVNTSNVRSRSLTLSWTAAHDSVGVASYRIFKNDSLIDTVNSDTTTYSAIGLDPDTEYTFKIEADDSSNNQTTGPSITVKTLDNYAAAPTRVEVTSQRDSVEIGTAPIMESVTAAVYDQHDIEMTGQNIDWSIVEKPIGVSISNEGILTIQPFASPGNITINGTVNGTDVTGIKNFEIKVSICQNPIPQEDVDNAINNVANPNTIALVTSSSVIAIDSQSLQAINASNKPMVLATDNVKFQLKPADMNLGTNTLSDVQQLQMGSTTVDDATNTQLKADSTLSNLSGGSFSSATTPFKLSAVAILNDINNTQDQVTTFNNPITISIPAPTGLSLAANQTLRACRFDTTTGKWEDKGPATLDNGFIKFDTSGFSYWTVMVKTASISGSSSGSGSSSSSSGSGSGSGNSTDPDAGHKPLNYVGAYLTNKGSTSSTTGDSIKNSKNVPVDATIKIVFDKNIVNEEIWSKNKTCFTLKDSSGKTIPIDVSCISDSVNFDERRNVFIKPVNNLTAGESYKIIVSPALLAKNGNSTLGGTTDNEGVTITFSTAGASAAGGAVATAVIPVVTKTDSNSNVVATLDSSKITDNAVNQIQIKEPKPESKINVQIPVSAVEKGSAGFEINTDSVKLAIPAGIIDSSSLSNGATVQVSKNLMPSVDAKALLANIPQGNKSIGKVFTFSMAVCDSSNKVLRDIHNFASGKSVTVTINLSSDDIKGMDTSKISAFYFDTTSKSWVDMGGILDEKSMTYTFSTTHFTDFTIMQKLSNVKRLAGLDRIETSIAIAKEQFLGKAPDAVVLTTANGFPDALSGEGLAYKYNAPMLLVNKSVNDSKNVLNYITSTLSKGKNIYILGGTGVVSTDISDYLTSQGYNIIRIGGDDRYETNQKVVENLNVTTGTSIVLASGNDFADALSVSSIAALKGYPVLLSGKDNLSANVINDITNIKPTNVYIIGGTGALSADIEAQIKNINGKINIVRLGGNDRYETSIKIVDYFNLDTDTITAASGRDFPDALSGSVLAAKKNSGILLIDNTDITRQKDLLSKHGIKSVIVLGGEGVISSDTANSLIQK